MFTTSEEVERLTGVVVTNDTVAQAQSLVETYVGRVEVDVVKPTDRNMLSKATVYQAAYMKTNPDVTFDQIALTSITEGNTTTNFNTDLFAPYISPWAVLACSKLSWRGSRSVKTGKTLGSTMSGYSWTHDTVVL